MPQPSTTSEALSTIESEIVEQKLDIDSFFLVPCEWPEKVTGTAPEAVLFQVNEIMTKYRHCFVRHNGLIEVLK